MSGGTTPQHIEPVSADHDREDGGWSEVPVLLASLYRVVQRLEAIFPGRRFTPDGHLVGSIGEALAARMFDLRLLKASTSVHDATSADERTLVQIKMTQGNRSVALRAEPEHLLVLRLDPGLNVEVVYNGNGNAPWAEAGPMQTNGQRPISLSKLRAMDAHVPSDGRLRVRNEVDLRRAPAGAAALTGTTRDWEFAGNSRHDGKQRKR